MPGMVTLGESMAVLSSPRPGPLRHAPHLDLSIGGAESNVAIGVRRLGHPAAWIGRVGADEFGALVLERLRAEQIDVRGALVDPDAPTGLLIKEQRTPDVTRVQYYRTGSAGSRLCPADVDAAADVIADADVLHLTGITPLLSRSAAEAVTHAVKLAVAANTLISLDVNHRAALGGAAELRERLTPLLPHLSHLFGSEEELLLLADATDEPSAVSRLGGPELVIKRGARGASVHPADGRPALHRPAVPVRALDPVGAGDAFVAGYLTALLEGAPIETRLHLACLTGAFAVTVPNDWSGQPTRAELSLLDAEAGTTLR
ncbi:2-dehydro-3-deoxygluconokinase [Streptomyces sp. 846.5]|nr:sugar kinase [Streptomyces sp. 846.5]TDU05457.1 2-dehydro-3-deoxygluconokinase [Streptomyces sp. 846.5]